MPDPKEPEPGQSEPVPEPEPEPEPEPHPHPNPDPRTEAAELAELEAEPEPEPEPHPEPEPEPEPEAAEPHPEAAEPEPEPGRQQHRAGRALASAREDGEPGCAHYRRRCKLVAPCCGEAYWCRHCHNEVHFEGQLDPAKAHQLDRSQVREVICGACAERQPVAAGCRACGERFGEYFCEPCRFYDDDTSKGQFHCVGCGLCRVGGRENYFHCQKCVACLRKYVTLSRFVALSVSLIPQSIDFSVANER